MDTRTFNSERNLIAGILNKIVNIIFPFAIRTIMIQTLGTRFLGLSSLFTSILSVLSLTELGFSTAVVYSMYKPLAERDTVTVRAILNFFRRVYRIIGCVLLIIGILLLPFLPKLIHGSYPSNVNIYLLYIIYLGNTCLSYWLFAYYNALVTAIQRIDVANNINTIMTAAMYAAQIAALLLTKNYYVYLIAMPVFTIINNLALRARVKYQFPEYYCAGEISSSMKQDIKIKVTGLLLDRLTNVTRNSFDSIFISMFLGLTQTALYNNYYYILSAVTGGMLILTNSISASVGNSVAVDTQRKNFSDMRRMNTIYMWLAGWCMVCLLCLYQPFMQIWMGKGALLPYQTVGLISVYFYVLKMGDIREVYSSAAGLWWENRYRAIIETILNLFLNYFMGKFWGIPGIVGATLISLFFVNFIYGSTIVFKYYFSKLSVWVYFKDHFRYAVTTTLAAVITVSICRSITFKNSLIYFTFCAICAVVVPNLIFYLIYSHLASTKQSIVWVRDKVLRNYNEKKRKDLG